MRRIATPVLYLCLLSLFLTISPAGSQRYGHVYRAPQHGFNLFHKHQYAPPPVKSIADDAVEYWENNKCIYPPKDFYMIFRDACDVSYDEASFYAGICRSFFNVSKSLCGLEGASEDEVQFMKSLTSMQSTIGNDEICDTLSTLRDSDASLFPHPQGESRWFEPSYNLLFSPATCPSVCGLPKAHPICFGFLFNYNYIQDSRDRKAEADEDEDDSPEYDSPDAAESEDGVEAPELDESAKEDNKTMDSSTDLNETDLSAAVADILLPLGNLSSSFRPNPKLLKPKPSDALDYYYELNVADLSPGEKEEEGIILSEALENHPELLKDILTIGDAILPEDNLSGEENIGDYPEEIKMEIVEEVVQLPNDVLAELQSSIHDDNSALQQQMLSEGLESLTRIDDREELPMLSILLLFSSAIAVLSICVLYKARKKIGIYVRHMRQRRRNNWNYERVLTVQPDDDEYYE